MWNMEGGSKKSGATAQGYVQEGNVDVLLVTDKPQKVRFLTEDPDIDQIMSDKKMTRVEAQEYINTKLMFESWIQPVPFWEHSWKAIPGVRFFGTQICPGMNCCDMCTANREAEANGVTENRLKPFPVRKRFFVPVWSYEFDRVMYLKQSQNFFEDIGVYLARQEGPVDFEVFKTGKGLDTKYKSTFIGPAEMKDTVEIPVGPGEFDFSMNGKPDFAKPTKQEVSAQTVQSSAPQEADADDPGAFIIPFGTHKSKTVAEVYANDAEYLAFLAENSTGLINTKVKAFMGAL